ncbi:type I-B CRISPR-associated protein Cas5b [Natronomonas sp. EA1]|uniref:type I-B CRISPR-associated protein Cas5b n=1 Tax=Natronomonas sp. EA1 TaxID=3421655 RepID=UPI003EBC41A8
MPETKLDRRTDGRGGPPVCLSFTVRGPWGHFRRVEGNIVKQTYGIVPRTTVAGLTAAILGLDRDSYYELFASESSAIAIEPVRPIRTMNMPMNTLSTANEHIQTIPSRGKGLKVGLPDPSKPRQQHNYEVLADPAYRIDLWLDDDEHRTRLRTLLEEGKSHYVPSLGLSEHLAEVEYHGTFDVEPGPDDDRVDVDSAVIDAVERIVPEPDCRHHIERSPAFMERDGRHRRTTGYRSVVYSPDAESLAVTDVETSLVDGRVVMFG